MQALALASMNEISPWARLMPWSMQQTPSCISPKAEGAREEPCQKQIVKTHQARVLQTCAMHSPWTHHNKNRICSTYKCVECVLGLRHRKQFRNIVCCLCQMQAWSSVACKTPVSDAFLGLGTHPDKFLSKFNTQIAWYRVNLPKNIFNAGVQLTRNDWRECNVEIEINYSQQRHIWKKLP